MMTMTRTWAQCQGDKKEYRGLWKTRNHVPYQKRTAVAQL